jgi:glyoxylase-like metal-dependent hydrolase (beta-lactamase superfamily II)
MIKLEKIGEIRKFLLARSVAGRSLYFTTAYWVDGLVVDTGCVFTIKELVNALAGLDVTTIVNTHSHEDHVAANSELQAKYGAKIVAHEEALPILANPGLKPLRPYQRIMWGYPPPSHGSAVQDILETKRYRFQVIHTPGHSADHICLFEPRQGWLFTGDAYVGGFDRSLRADYNIWMIIDSLKKLVSLKPKVLFPGSGTVRENAREELTKKIVYLEKMGLRVQELYGKGWSRRNIRRKLFGSEMFIAYFTLGHFSGRNLVRSYIEDRSC